MFIDLLHWSIITDAIRLDGWIKHCNLSPSLTGTSALQAEASLRGEAVKRILLDIGGCSHVDTTALDAIKEWREGYERRVVDFGLLDPNPHVTETVHKAFGHDAGE